MRPLPLLTALVAGVAACTPPVTIGGVPLRGRPCGDVVDYPTDTTIDAEDPPKEKGPRQLSYSGPQYPSEMRRQSIEGTARVSFVIDTTGHVPRGTVFITAESDLAFGSAVCTWLARRDHYFEPLEVNGRKYAVRVLNMPVEFSLTRVP
jgi:TonB family protein